MLRRLLAFLLICGLAIPAMAAPLHCAAMAAPQADATHSGAHAGHHGQQAPAEPGALKLAPAMKDCIGCAALRGPAAPLAAPLVLPALPMAEPALTALAEHHPAPETPPPRRLA